MNNDKLHSFIEELQTMRRTLSATELQNLAKDHSITRNITTILVRAKYATKVKRGLYLINPDIDIKIILQAQKDINHLRTIKKRNKTNE
jgi:hypothetical protein